MQPEDRTRLVHMVEAAEDVSRFATGRTRSDLDTDRVLLFALVRGVEVFGEAASKISAAMKAATPEIPWPEIIGMRNRLVHAYFDIDADIVWETATEEIPALLPRLRGLLSE
jgi:uncharacterized protein with HEPN domain